MTGTLIFVTLKGVSHVEQIQRGGDGEQIQHWPSRPPGGVWPGQAIDPFDIVGNFYCVSELTQTLKV